MGFLANLHHLGDWALLVLRLGLGAIFLVHGRQKLRMWKMQPSAQMPRACCHSSKCCQSPSR